MNARFRFLLITLAALLAFAVALALGFWQLSRASQKEAWQAHIDQQAAAPRLDGPALAMLPDPVLEMHRGVLLRGRWLPAHTVFLDNRPMNGKTGLYVATPLQLEGSSAVVLVLRGWVARNFVDRARLPCKHLPKCLKSRGALPLLRPSYTSWATRMRALFGKIWI